MKFMYFFDDKIKRHIMKGKKYCNPAETGNYECGISCIRQGGCKSLVLYQKWRDNSC